MASQTLTTRLRGHCLCGACSYTLDPSIPIKSDSFVQTFGNNFFSCYDRPSPPSRRIIGVDVQADCSQCRRATASLATAYFIVPTESLVWSEGSEAHLKTYLSSDGDVERRFCGDCGTPLTFYNRLRAAKRTDCVDVTIASLADEDLARLEELGVAPTQTHCWWESGVEWYKRECET